MLTTAELFGKFHYPRRKTATAAARLRRKPLLQIEALCAHWLTAAHWEPQPAGDHSRQRIYTYKTTFLAFLNQALNPGSSCRDAVRHVQAYYQNQPVPRRLSPDNSPYCQARANLPLGGERSRRGS